MNPHAHRIWLAALCVVAGCLSGCIRPNMRHTVISTLSARATIQKGVLPLYHEVKIARPADASAPRFCLRLPDGQIVERASLTCDGLRQAGFKETHRDYRQQYYDRKLGTTSEISHEFRGQGVAFLFVGDTLVETLLFTSEKDAVAIGREGTKQFYTLPLTQTDLEYIFGHPDKVYDGVSW